MNKESLEIVRDEIYKIVDNKKIETIDKIELLINLTQFLDPDKYEENIQILSKTNKFDIK